MKTNILIAGDTCPIGINSEPFVRGDLEQIYNGLLDEIESSDLSIANLECPLTDTQSPIKKHGPILVAQADCVNGLPFDVVTLANNHIMDHGASGLTSTISHCHNQNIQTVGAGDNIDKASTVLIKNVNNIRFGILAIAENEFSVATHRKPGANPLDIIHIQKTIERYKSEYDYLIVLLHTGISNYPLPSPKLRELCHFLVDHGAHGVICQHSHCAGCHETYHAAHIVYGQGNFIFNQPYKTNQSWNTGFLIKLGVGDAGQNIDLQLIPHIQYNNKIGVRKLTGDAGDNFLNAINERSRQILNTGYVESEWKRFCNSQRTHYLNKLFNVPIVLRKIDRRVRFLKYFYKTDTLLVHENLYRSESHREVVETVLEELRENES